MKKILIAVSALAFAFALSAKPLKLDVPRAQIIGTPVPVKLPNLEPKTPNPEPDVPEDVKNVAKGKKVTSSDDFPLIGELELVTDGDKGAAEGCYVELMNGLQWIQIDLEKQTEIFAVAMWHPEFIKGVTTIFNSDHDNSAKKGAGKDKAYIETNIGKLVVVNPPVKARYIRLFSNGNTTNDMNHYIEVEVYGR